MKLTRYAVAILTFVIGLGVHVAVEDPSGIGPFAVALKQVDLVPADPMRITSFSAKSIGVQNLSNKIIRSFAIKVFAAGNDKTPVEVIRVGNRGPQNLIMLKPTESMRIPITPETFQTFIKHSKPLLHIQLAEIRTSHNSDLIFELDRNFEAGYRVMIEMR